MSAQAVGKWAAQRQRIVEETQEQYRRANRMLAAIGEPSSATLIDVMERLVAIDPDRLEQIAAGHGIDIASLTFFDATANDWIAQDSENAGPTGPDLLAQHMRNAWRSGE